MHGAPNPNLKPSIVIVILPQHAAEIRKAVKYWGEIRTGIPTQCVVRSSYGGSCHNSAYRSIVQRAGKYDDPKYNHNEGAFDQYCNNVALK